MTPLGWLIHKTSTQTNILQHLIWVFTVCKGLSVLILRVLMVLQVLYVWIIYHNLTPDTKKTPKNSSVCFLWEQFLFDYRLYYNSKTIERQSVTQHWHHRNSKRDLVVFLKIWSNHSYHIIGMQILSSNTITTMHTKMHNIHLCSMQASLKVDSMI